MKKVMFAMAAVLCLGLASCSGDCKCTTTIDVAGTKTNSTVIISEETLQSANTTCKDYAKIMEDSQITIGDNSVSVKCKQQ